MREKSIFIFLIILFILFFLNSIQTSALPPKSSNLYIYYQVKKGDTLEKIAQKYKVSIKDLKEWNNLKTNRIKIGQKLIVGVIKEKKVEKEKSKEISDIEKIFLDYEREYQNLINKPKVTQKEWLILISKYRRLYLLYPGNKIASQAILRTADIYFRLYKSYPSQEYLKQAIEKYQFLIKNYPHFKETEEAYYNLILIYKEELKNKEISEKLQTEFRAKYPQSPYLFKLEKSISQKDKKLIIKKENLLKETPKKEEIKEIKTEEKKEEKIITNLRKVLEIKPVTGEDYTRIIIAVSDNFEYQANILKGTEDKPPRIYVDIYPATIDKDIPKELELKEAHLTKIRASQFDKSTVRVVLDLSSLTYYKIFKLKEPYQLVLDLIGKEKIAKKSVKETKPESKQEERYINLARQFGLNIKKIVIDPGHGGEDPGAVGPSGVKEKDVVLFVAKLLKQKLETQLGIEIILTREDDKFIPLIQRPAIANSKKADLFISLHTNASPNSNGCGIETYYLNFTTDPEAMRVAALENAASDKNLSDLQDLIKAILANTKLSESRLLAEKIQTQLVNFLRRYYPNTMDRGVKYAPFLVLVGTRMPAVLIELPFITNPVEESLLKDRNYLELIADGIAKGIEIYIQSLKFSQSYYDKKS